MAHVCFCGRLATSLLLLAAAGPAPGQVSTARGDGRNPAPFPSAAAEEASVLDLLRQAGATEEQAGRLREILAGARGAGLPTDMIIFRVREGLAKQASAEAIERAVQTRWQSLRDSASALDRAGYGAVAPEQKHILLPAVALALESGVPAPDLGDVLARGQGRFAMRMKSIVEAGETLHLAGFASKTVKDLMGDCIERNLGRMEVLRAVRYCIERRHNGLPDADIRASLWGSKTNGAAHGPGDVRGVPH